jgi:hypothetical protein
MDAARALGIAFRVDDETYRTYKEEYDNDLEASAGRTHHQLPVPAVMIVGTDGVLDYVYVNPDYKVRMSPAELVAVAAEVKRGDR